MRHALLASAFVGTAVLPLSAVSVSAQSPSTATPPSNMGRWDKFRERQEEQKRFDTKREFDRTPKARSIPAGFEDKQAVLADFADCVLAEGPKQSAELLSTSPGSREENVAARKLMSFDTCTRGRPYVSGRTGEWRGALAEIALKRDVGKLDALSARASVPPVRIAERTTGTREFVVAYSQCLALAAPAQGVALVKTEYRSEAEKSALLAIGEPLKACMPEGVAYSINIRDVRNHLADALYRMSGEPNA